MQTKTKSSMTLTAAELELVAALQAKLEGRSKVEVVRRGPGDAYRSASRATRASLVHEIAELDHLAAEGLDES